jgi:hypothetical protein
VVGVTVVGVTVVGVTVVGVTVVGVTVVGVTVAGATVVGVSVVGVSVVGVSVVGVTVMMLGASGTVVGVTAFEELGGRGLGLFTGCATAVVGGLLVLPAGGLCSVCPGLTGVAAE